LTLQRPAVAKRYSAFHVPVYGIRFGMDSCNTSLYCTSVEGPAELLAAS